MNEVKLLHIEDKNRVKQPHYEIVCPCCRSKIIFDEHLFSCCSFVYCHYCREKIAVTSN